MRRPSLGRRPGFLPQEPAFFGPRLRPLGAACAPASSPSLARGFSLGALPVKGALLGPHEGLGPLAHLQLDGGGAQSIAPRKRRLPSHIRQLSRTAKHTE